jgi:hypothetical protein
MDSYIFPGKEAEVAIYYLCVKGGRRPFPLNVRQFMIKNSDIEGIPTARWDSLRFTTIPGKPWGKAFPEFFRVRHPDRVLWWGIVSSFEEKRVLMVVYSNATKGCIAHACFIIQFHKTYLMTPLYVKDKKSYESFARLEVEDDFSSQKISANVFEVDRYYGSTPSLERSGRLSNDNGKTWTLFGLTFSLETMSPTLTLMIPPEHKP